jgi:hypothetical protein
VIRGQRLVHVLVFALLAIALPALLRAALHDRPARSANGLDRLGSLASRVDSPALHGVDRSEPFAGLGLGVFARTEDTRVTLSVLAPRDFTVPDAFAYAAKTLPGADGLPPDARLLGAILPGSTARFELQTGETTLVVFSLAWQEIPAAGVVVEGSP